MIIQLHEKFDGSKLNNSKLNNSIFNKLKVNNSEFNYSKCKFFQYNSNPQFHETPKLYCRKIAVAIVYMFELLFFQPFFQFSDFCSLNLNILFSIFFYQNHYSLQPQPFSLDHSFFDFNTSSFRFLYIKIFVSQSTLRSTTLLLLIFDSSNVT